MAHVKSELVKLLSTIPQTEADLLRQLNEYELNPLKTKPGPNLWETVKLDTRNYGRDYDFEIYDHGDTFVVYPTCEAALQWCYRFLPEDCPRWGAKGFVVEQTDLIVRQMREHGLISEEEYASNMLDDETKRQWE